MIFPNRRHRGSAHGVMRELGMEPQGGARISPVFFTSTFSWLHPHSPQHEMIMMIKQLVFYIVFTCFY